MKKIQSVILCFALLGSLFSGIRLGEGAQVDLAQSEEYYGKENITGLLQDINGDAIVNMKDIYLVLQSGSFGKAQM